VLGCYDDGIPRALSLDLRERRLRALASGLSAVEIEHHTGVDATTLRRWRQRQACGESLAPRTAPGRVPLIGPAQDDALRAEIAAHPDDTLAEHCARWAAEHGQTVRVPTMCGPVRPLRLPLSKSR
jgi:transposase